MAGTATTARTLVRGRRIGTITLGILIGILGLGSPVTTKEMKQTYRKLLRRLAQVI